MADVSRTVADPIVLVDGTVAPYLKAISARHSAGGASLDSALLMYRPVNDVHDALFYDVQLKNETLLQGVNIEIVQETLDGPIVLHFGRVTQVRPSTSKDDQTYEVVSALQPYMFGKPLVGMLTLDKRAADNEVELYIDGDLVFNPQHDGKTVGNMSSFTSDAGFNYFLDPRSNETDAAATWRDDVDSEWTVATAITYLCELANGDETYVLNWTETTADLETLLEWRKPHGVRIRYGAFLPEALDTLLEPIGFSWYVEYTGVGERRLNFFRRDATNIIDAYVGHQKPLEKLNQSATNCERFDFVFDVGSRLVNQVTLQGDFAEVEATWELVKTWDESLDNLTADNLMQDSAASALNPTYRRVWREWALNEAGDYIGTRDSVDAPFRFSPYEQASEQQFDGNGRFVRELQYGYFAIRRKRFLPCVTRGPDGTPAGEHRGMRVEYTTLGSAASEDGTDWKLWPSDNVQFLEKEAGIRFNDDAPPFVLIEAGSNARVRVTATLRTDTRISATAGSPTGSVNADLVPIVLDVGEKYHRRVVHSSSPFYNDEAYTDASVDDVAELYDLALLLVNTWNSADCAGRTVIDGCDFSGFRIGQAVAQIAGMGLRLQTHHEQLRFPRIVAIEYMFPMQQTILVLDTHRINPLEDM